MKKKYGNTGPKRGLVFPGIILCITFSVILALVTACAASEPEFDLKGGDTIMSAKQRQAPQSLKVARVPELVNGNSAFAFDLYHQLYDRGENLVFSPYSLSIPLAMTYAGARGETEAQMAQVLHFDLPQTQLHPAFNSLGQNLEGREGVKLHIANAMWGSNSTKYLQPFLDTLAENYGAGVRLLDFLNPDDSRQKINQWVSDQTEERISELLPPGSIGGETDLILTNAIFFQAPWANPFQENNTQDADFTLLDGDTVQVKMMTQVAQVPYAKIAGAQVIELPYEGDDLSMLVFLPEAGTFETFTGSLDTTTLEDVTSTLQPAVVQLSMPRFQVEYKEHLRERLMALGMVDAFGDANFSGMDGSHELFIDQVYHQAIIDVDEAGTEAAAGSAVVMTRKGIPGIDVVLAIDHPFLFLIRDNHSGAILFLGHVLDPSLE